MSIYKGYSKSSKPNPKRRAIAEYFVATSYKTRKINSNFSLNFCVGEAHLNVRGVRQI